MRLFVGSLAVFFAAGCVAFVAVRMRAGVWRPAGAPPLPYAGLAWGTGCLLVISLALERGVRQIRRGRSRSLVLHLRLALGLAVAFLGIQTWNSIGFHRPGLLELESLYAFTFYMLTGLHALHVVGGLVALGVVTRRARRAAYSWAHHLGVRHCALYWHFLGAVWLVLLVLLVLAA